MVDSGHAVFDPSSRDARLMLCTRSGAFNRASHRAMLDAGRAPMKRSASVVTIAVLVAGGLGVARAEEPAPIPDSCPVTLPTEPRYDPDLPYRLEPNANSFWYGSDALFVPIRADGRWHTDS